jgi:hypothetical protein
MDCSDMSHFISHCAALLIASLLLVGCGESDRQQPFQSPSTQLKAQVAESTEITPRGDGSTQVGSTVIPDADTGQSTPDGVA